MKILWQPANLLEFRSFQNRFNGYVKEIEYFMGGIGVHVSHLVQVKRLEMSNRDFHNLAFSSSGYRELLIFVKLHREDKVSATDKLANYLGDFFTCRLYCTTEVFVIECTKVY